MDYEVSGAARVMGRDYVGGSAIHIFVSDTPDGTSREAWLQLLGIVSRNGDEND